MSRTNSAASSAAAVANTFLEFYRAEPGVAPVDQMKLQKLLFYAHAWHLGYTGNPLFDEDVQAWPWGPVVPDIYRQTRRFGRAPITGMMQRYVPDPGRGVRSMEPTVEEGNLRHFLRSVWDSHKYLTGVQLSNSTHAPGEPWALLKELNRTLEDRPQIPNDLIRSVYAPRASAAQQAARG